MGWCLLLMVSLADGAAVLLKLNALFFFGLPPAFPSCCRQRPGATPVFAGWHGQEHFAVLSAMANAVC